MMKSVTENVVADVLIQETTACHHGTCGRVVKNDMSHGRKSPREIHACRPASWWTRSMTCSKPYITFRFLLERF